MTDKFKVYAQTRATRQLAGDVERTFEWDDPEKDQWREIENLLNDVECKLERMNLK